MGHHFYTWSGKTLERRRMEDREKLHVYGEKMPNELLYLSECVFERERERETQGMCDEMVQVCMLPVFVWF